MALTACAWFACTPVPNPASSAREEDVPPTITAPSLPPARTLSPTPYPLPTIERPLRSSLIDSRSRDAAITRPSNRHRSRTTGSPGNSFVSLTTTSPHAHGTRTPSMLSPHVADTPIVGSSSRKAADSAGGRIRWATRLGPAVSTPMTLFARTTPCQGEFRRVRDRACFASTTCIL